MRMKRHRAHPNGFTLIELTIAGGLIAVLALCAVKLTDTIRRGMTDTEARTVLNLMAQDVLNQIKNNLSANRRLFQNTTNDLRFLARLPPSVVPLGGSALPKIEAAGTLSPVIRASVGNSLFFASLDRTLDSPAPPALVDIYRFNYYHLAADGVFAAGVPRRLLWEWRSVPYADRAQLMAIPDNTNRQAVVRALVGQNVRLAWDGAATDPNDAFFELSGGGDISADRRHVLVTDTVLTQNLLRKVRGAAPGGFSYSVAANTGNSFRLSHTVPLFAATSAGVPLFPSGFETMAVGPGSGRKVFLRLVLAARGGSNGFRSVEQTVLATCRDIY